MQPPREIDDDLIDGIDRCLPQTQCTLCSYPKCRDYAHALASGEASINQCPPGGDVTIRKLARLLGKPALPLDTAYGEHQPKSIARVIEPDCIGCKLCIKACPVDCIVGAAKMMHTVIADQCTGCKLCLPVCPTDCIVMEVPAPLDPAEPVSQWPGYSQRQVEQARENCHARLSRIEEHDRKRTEQKRVTKRRVMQREIERAVRRKASQTNDMK